MPPKKKDTIKGQSPGGSSGDSDDDDDDDGAILLTREGLKKLQEELEKLKTEGRLEVAERLREAIAYGDLSENSEYEDAKNEQAFIEGRILELENKVKNAKIITGKHTTVVQIGSEVTIRNITSRGNEETYTIVGSTEADPLDHKLSNESPIGAAILEYGKGDKVKVEAPAGVFTYEICKIK
jgi:transcription elongation factor GreA